MEQTKGHSFLTPSPKSLKSHTFQDHLQKSIPYHLLKIFDRTPAIFSHCEIVKITTCPNFDMIREFT